jgi:hypothetical protein
MLDTNKWLPEKMGRAEKMGRHQKLGSLVTRGVID